MVLFAPFSMHERKSFAFKIGCYWKSHKKQYYTSAIFFLGQLRSAAFFYDLVGTLRKSPKLRNMLLPPPTSDLWKWCLLIHSTTCTDFLHIFFPFPKWYALEWSEQTLSFLKVFPPSTSLFVEEFLSKTRSPQVSVYTPIQHSIDAFITWRKIQ